MHCGTYVEVESNTAELHLEQCITVHGEQGTNSDTFFSKLLLKTYIFFYTQMYYNNNKMQKLFFPRMFFSPVVLLWNLQRHSSLSTHTPSCRTMSPGQPQVGLHSDVSIHSVSPWRSLHERGHSFPQGHSSCPPPQSEFRREGQNDETKISTSF